MPPSRFGLKSPPGRPGPSREFRTIQGVDTTPKISSVIPNTSRTEGGVAVTITGYNFRAATDGTTASVTFGGVAATSVVVVSANSITCVTPAYPTASVVDVSVTCDGQTGTLLQGFTYYEPSITRVVPSYGPIAGATDVILEGYNFIAGCTISFGGVAATNVAFIDSQHYVARTPAHAQGHVDVEMVEPSLNVITLRSGFRYTLLTRGEDIRRFPGISIKDVLNNTPNTCTFIVDGSSNKPDPGEKIEIVDANDGNRLLFAGTAQSIKQVYEGLTDQLAWEVTCIDFTGLLNKRRPFVSYDNISVTAIVKDLVARYCPGFTSAHVQTNLAKITATFDGTKDMATVFSDLGNAIGGGHWYVDYIQDVHFFHVVPPGVLGPTAVQAPLGNGPGTGMTVAEGASIPSTFSFPPMQVYFRTTFIYSNGLETAYSPISNIIALSGTKIISFTGVPIGAVIGALTVVTRRIYYTVVGSGTVVQFVDINDNVTTSFTTWFASLGASVATVVSSNVNAPVPPTVVVPPPAGPTRAPQLVQGSTYWIDYEHSIGRLLFITDQLGATYTPGLYTFVYTWLYEDGTESLPSPASGAITSNGSQGLLVSDLDVGPSINGSACKGIIVYGAIHQGVSPTPAWQYLTRWTPLILTTELNTKQIFPAGGPLQQPPHMIYGDPGSPGSITGPGETYPEPVIPIWPNNDGPSLELTDPPDDIDDLNTDLLRDPQFTSEEDLSQVRNKVHVIGSGTSVVAAAAVGESTLTVADIDLLSAAGGQILVGNLITEYLGISGRLGQGIVYLLLPLAAAISEGTAINLYQLCEDHDAQRQLGRIELDFNGNPTDGVHEYTIRDASLVLPLQLYMRGMAELELFGRPIVTIDYATRDPKTKSGKIVHVDLTNPPCVGDFLIQDVTIDQVHDENDTLFPRYTVRASSVKFDLTDLLLQIIGNIGNGQSLAGVVSAAVNQAGNAGDPFSERVGWAFHIPTSAGAPTYKGAAMATLASTGTVPVYDSTLQPGFGQPPTRNNFKWVACVTTAAASNTSGLSNVTDWFFIENSFEMTFLVKTGPSVIDLILWVGLQSAAIGAVSPSKLLTNQSYLGFRYASGGGTDGDGGWVGVLQNQGVGHKQTVTNPIAACTPDTEYLMTIQTQGFPPSTNCAVSFQINEGAWTTVEWSDTVDATQTPPFNMPICHDQAGGATGLGVIVGVVTKVNATKRILFDRLSYRLP